MGTASFEYTGNELELFAGAKNWKAYVAEKLKPYIKGDVLEAGAGIGSNTTLFFNPEVKSWLLLEPDKNFCSRLESMIANKQLNKKCTVFNGYTQQLTEQFDCIIYIDVIEHIQDDKKEIQTATDLLNPGGTLIVLSPAHNFLMSPFDKAIGHYRRYSKKTLITTGNEKISIKKIFYLDSIGLMASLANKYFLKQDYPSKKEIAFWDSVIIPVSKFIDRILLFKAGKTIIGIWEKIDAP